MIRAGFDRALQAMVLLGCCLWSLAGEAAHVPVLTYHYDNMRRGANTNETVLTPANVNVASFGKLFTHSLDGYVYAQPLILPNVTIPGNGVHNVVLVATEHNTVYAFDADSNTGVNGGLLWSTNLGIAANTLAGEYGNLPDLVPEEGATGTPVIDPVTGTIYLDAFTREVNGQGVVTFRHRIHALDVATGAQRPYSPVIVAASVSGKGIDSVGGRVTFNAIQQMQRPALTLAGGVLYVCYGSHGDADTYHGWVIGFNPTNLVQLTNQVFNTSPNASAATFGPYAGEAGIWMGGNGLAVDAQTNLFLITGNGSFSQHTNGGDYGSSFVKLSVATNRLYASDYFTPYNHQMLSDYDLDLGAGGPLLLPDAAGSPAHPHLLVSCGKEGRMYLLDRDNLGHYHAGSDSQIVQSLINVIGDVYSTPAYFNNTIYFQAYNDAMRAFFVSNAIITPTPTSMSSVPFGFPGATPVVSANGRNNGIVWATDSGAYASSGPAVLHAFDAGNLANELYNSSQNLARDNPGGAVKMTAPVVSDGKVYVGAQYALSVYGLSAFLSAPVILPPGGSFNNSVTVTLSNTAPGAVVYYTKNGTTPTTNATPYTGPFVLTNSTVVKAIAAGAGAVNSAVVTASFNNTSANGTGAGLTGAYFDAHDSINPYTGQPTLVRTDSVVSFDWNASGPAANVGPTLYTVRWTGCLQPQYDETYTLYATADDGVRVWINGKLLINGWFDQGATSYQTNLTLKAQQYYNIEMDYYQKWGGAVASLSWSSPSTPAVIIPQSQLYPFTNPPPTIVLAAPVANASYAAPASVTISATADTPYNSIQGVSFFANGTALGSATNLPYTITATGLGAGSYALTAVATDSSGLASTSAPVNITVSAGSGLPYGLPARGIVPAYFNMPTTYNGALPALLSQSGIFSNTPAMTVNSGLVPYTPNAPFWSDGAGKTRYVSIPNNGGVITPGEQIGFTATGSWTFPAGSVFVKTFEISTDETNPGIKRRLETRLLVRDSNGGIYGVTYKWRTNNLDADLLTGSLTENILITNATGIRTQAWYYPSPADCITCHTPQSGHVLGLSTRQLNGSLTYAATGVTDNQLRTLNARGFFNPAFNETNLTGYAKLSALTNVAASLQERARSYLDANCAGCHRPGGPGGTFDARYDTAFASQNLTNYPAAFSLGLDHAQIIAPKDIWRSVIYQRVNTTNTALKMPPLGRNLVDSNAVVLLRDWINSLPGLPALAPATVSPNGGPVLPATSITLSAPDTNAAIYYTLDGSLPTTNSLRYLGPISLAGNASLAASAYRAGYNNSVAVNAAFFLQSMYFTAVKFLPDRQLQLSFTGVPGSNYVLQATTNFSTWTPVSTNAATTNLFNLLDPKATNFPYRFYRVREQ